MRGLSGLAKPNYVLTSDQRYRRIWDAYQALLRRQNDVDEAWTWQGRLWGDLVTMAVLTALLDDSNEALALAPLYLRREQDRGRWLEVQGCVGVFATEDHVVMVYAADTAPAEIRTRYAPLAPTLIVTRDRIGGGQARDILVWSVAHAGIEAMGLESQVEEAAQALANWHRDPSHRPVHALLVMAPESENSPLICVGRGDVQGFTLPLVGEGFAAAIAQLARLVARKWPP